MPIQPVNPFVLKDVDFLIGAAGADDVVTSTDPDFAAAADTIQLVPTAQTVTWTGLKGNTFTDVSPATWAANVNGAQDWDEDGSLSRLMHEHEGETRPYLMRPRSGTGASFKGKLVLAPGAIGGSGNAVAPFSATFGLTGKPQLVEA